MMVRLALLALAFGLLTLPTVGGAQQTKVYRVGLLRQGSPPPPGSTPMITKALHDLGYIEGRNLFIGLFGDSCG